MNLKIFENDLVILKLRSPNKSQPIYGSNLFRVIKIYDYTVKLLRLADNLELFRHKRDLKVVREANGKIHNIPPEIRGGLGLITLDKNNLGSQLPLLKNLVLEDDIGMTTRRKTKIENLNDKIDEIDSNFEESSCL